MDALFCLIVLVVLLIMLRRLAHWVSPEIVRLIDTVVRGCWRTFTDVVWRSPVRRWGASKVLWLYLLLFTIVATAGAIGSGDARLIPGLLLWWFLVIAGWWVMRWLARRRYRPRRMPTRRPRR